MRWALISALCLTAAQPAWSLSCLRPDIARDFADAAASEDSYILVKGKLFFDETKLPKRGDGSPSDMPEGADIPAWFDGYSLTPDGFTRRFQRDVILRVTCVASWCGSTSNGEHLAFLKRADTDFIMQLDPCGGMTYRDPTREQERTVTRCMRGEGCDPVE
ncbi:MAG TPA: hypothetical protein VJ928_02410 [Marivita sp.]|nr:hypothetical protein [Marivita sp.]